MQGVRMVSPPSNSEGPAMMNRRVFLGWAAALGSGLLLGAPRPAKARAVKPPLLTFYGATQQVSGSCHLLVTGGGLFLVDCG